MPSSKMWSTKGGLAIGIGRFCINGIFGRYLYFMFDADDTWEMKIASWLVVYNLSNPNEVFPIKLFIMLNVQWKCEIYEKYCPIIYFFIIFIHPHIHIVCPHSFCHILNLPLFNIQIFCPTKIRRIFDIWLCGNELSKLDGFSKLDDYQN
jgi:hypothetical protein